jgi:chromosome segregation ATPase
MKTRPDLPESLRTYAAAALGSFPVRYEQILERAFTDHKMILNASMLRELAGGGSNTTAQESIEKFRSKLSAATGDLIRFGPQVPEEIATRMSSVMTDLWIQSKKIAGEDFQEERLAMTELIEKHKDLAHELQIQCSQLTDAQAQSLVAFEQAKLALDLQVTQLTADLSSQSQSAQALLSENKDLIHALDKHKSSALILSSSLEQAKSQLQTALLHHAQEKDAMRQQFTLQVQDLQRENSATTQRLLKERDAARSAEAKERSTNTELTIASAKNEQKLFSAQQSLDRLQQELDSANAQKSNLKADVSEIKVFTRGLQEALAEVQSKLDKALAELAASEKLVTTLSSLLESQKNRMKVTDQNLSGVPKNEQ